MILIVNDLPAAAYPFSKVLTHSGLPHQVIETFADAQASLRRPCWTGFILDIFLPGGTGVDLLEALRRRPRYRQTPAAVITADIMLDDALLARIQKGRATLHVGVFDRPTVENICLDLVLARREDNGC
jgi:CheY-like chemotaxis protein